MGLIWDAEIEYLFEKLIFGIGQMVDLFLTGFFDQIVIVLSHLLNEEIIMYMFYGIF